MAVKILLAPTASLAAAADLAFSLSNPAQADLHTVRGRMGSGAELWCPQPVQAAARRMKALHASNTQTYENRATAAATVGPIPKQPWPGPCRRPPSWPLSDTRTFCVRLLPAPLAKTAFHIHHASPNPSHCGALPASASAPGFSFCAPHRL